MLLLWELPPPKYSMTFVQVFSYTTVMLINTALRRILNCWLRMNRPAVGSVDGRAMGSRDLRSSGMLRSVE